MSETLQDLLDEKDLRDFAGYEIFVRGFAYYRSGRVEIESANQEEARVRVRGTRYYYVNLWTSRGELGVMCTCPHAESGWFCKHMVASGIAVQEYLGKYGGTSWRETLNNTLQEKLKTRHKKTPKPYWYFVSLQPDDYGWELKPYRLWLDRVSEDVFPQDKNLIAQSLPKVVSKKNWLLQHIKSIRSAIVADGCTNAGLDAIAFAKLLLRQGQPSQTYFNYHRFNYPLGDYLSLLSLLKIPLFTGNFHNPVRKHLQVMDLPGEIALRIEQTNEGIHIALELICGGENLDLGDDRPQILTNKNPYWVLVGDRVLTVNTPFSADRLISWMRTPEIIIPPEDDSEFLVGFFPALAEQFPISGDDIKWEEVKAEPVKRIYLTDTDGELEAHLRFGYGHQEVTFSPNYPDQSIHRIDNSWTLARIHRQSEFEGHVYRSVSSAHHGLKRSRTPYPPQVFLLRARVHPIDFLMRHIPRLTQAGFEIYGEEKLKTARVNRNKPTMSLNVSSGIDWFDLRASVAFGDVEASLNEVRRALHRKERYIKLADGTMGEIPEDWIERYKHLFGLGEPTDDGMRLSNHHLTLIDQILEDADRIQTDDEFRRSKRRLLDFKGIQARDLSGGFKGELRPYQKAGFDWLHFLHEFEFGGCLADDMGLGKTIETLALLQSLRENGHSQAADLLVLPRSLLVNWQREAERFTPDLRVHFHFGNQRKDDASIFNEFDLVLTTYGTMLRDIELLKTYNFHYIVLDESQAIKNPLAKTSKAARLLRSNHRLALTGTPVENSTFELWSLFAFLNPGLLGSLEYFKKEFGNPIEKQGDEIASQFLRKLVYPFILRRTKGQVAPELPPRTERVVYSDMEPAQRRFYNKTRDYYRAMLIGVIEEQGMNNARLKVLEGLLRLRQICNHPRLVKDDFRGSSSKFELLVETLETLHLEGHKALVFSQFVSMLTILRETLDNRKIPYVYLDGRTRKRQACVDEFQNNSEISFFLISLRAGGVGLNLTAADYVIHIDPWWNPAVEMQATDRTHRIGQDKPVFVYKLIARNSVEEKILQLQEKKKNLVAQLITTESSFFKSLTSADVETLFS